MPPDLDGKNIWESLYSNVPSPRKEVLVNINPIDNTSALRHENFKLVVGVSEEGRWDQRFQTNGGRRPATDLEELMDQSLAAKVLMDLLPEQLQHSPYWRDAAIVQCDKYSSAEDQLLGESPYLFNIEEDSCEQINLASKNRKVSVESS